MTKMIVLYNYPDDVEAFEKYYNETHLPLAAKFPNVHHAEFTKFVTGPDGNRPLYYRMAEIYFANDTAMMQSLSSDDGKAAASDIPKFATAGFLFLVGKI